MFYPEQFKNAVFQAYPLTAPGQFGQTPSPARIRLAVETGDEALGQLLYEGRCEKLDPLEIIKAFGTGQPNTVLAKAQQLLNRQAVADQWLAIRQMQNASPAYK